MPPVPGDFQAPRGEIEGGFFPKDSPSSLAARIQEYIDQAVAVVGALELDPAEIDIDGAISELVYSRLYDAILLRIGNTPNTSISDQGSVSYSSAQIKIFEDKRERHALAYDAIIADVAVPPTEQPIAPTTHARIINTF